MHLCAYCYARCYKWSVHPEKTGEVEYYSNIPEKLEQELSTMTLCPPLYLCATTDVFQPVDEIVNSTVEVVKRIMRFGVSFHIVTKSAIVRKLLDVPGFTRYPYFFLQMSVETIDDEKRRILSPNSSPIKDRIETLGLFSSKGFYTVMRIDPIIFGYTDDRNEILHLLHSAKEVGVKHIITSTTRFDAQGIQAVGDRLVKAGLETVYKRVKENYALEKGWLRVPRRNREEFHKWLKNETEKFRMTFAVCMELDRSYDSSSIPHCEGSPNSHMMIKMKEGNFKPICNADCLRSCPNKEEPPCGAPQLAVEYPYKVATLSYRTAQSTQLKLR
jgi:DNA repair photolyase